jgi:hypothetical protein
MIAAPQKESARVGGPGAGIAERQGMDRPRAQYSPADPQRLLGLLEAVRRCGKGWIAKCPAHADRRASLSIAVGEDGRILLCCFAGCSAADVLGAVGLRVADLFPRRLTDATPEARRELRERARLADLKAAAGVLDLESAIVLLAAVDLGLGKALSEADQDRLALAVERIRAARVALGVVR